MVHNLLNDEQRKPNYGPVPTVVFSVPALGAVGLGEDEAREQGLQFVRAKVGDRYVKEMMEQEGWALGGESSGHIICLDRTTTGDGTISALQVLSAMERQGKSLRELLDGVSKYPQTLINVRMAERINVVDQPPVKTAVADAEAELNGAGRVLLRSSGTEPLIRVMVEGKDGKQVQSVAEGLADVVKQAVS